MEDRTARAPAREEPMTPKLAEELGLGPPPPAPKPCPHCGRPLEPRGVRFRGGVMWFGSERCGCPGAEEERARASERDAAAAKLDRARRLDAAGIPRRYHGAQASERACLAFPAAEEGRGLYIHGPSRAGKTHNACAVACAASDAGGRVVFTTSIRMLARLKETFDTSMSSEEAFRRYSRAGLLVVDDLGKEQDTAWAVATLFDLVDLRYGSMLPTVFTSQYDLAGLRRRLARCGESETAEAIVARIRENCDEVGLPPRGGPPRVRRDIFADIG